MTDSRAADPTGPGDAAPSLATLADEAWAAAMEDGPLDATAIGDHGHLSTLPANDAGAAERTARRLHSFLDRYRNTRIRVVNERIQVLAKNLG